MKTSAVLQVALIGNPNTGKSTLFNALSGMRQRVGNYPGVTVEKKVGNVQLNDISVELLDLPGVYSLCPQSPDELLAIDALLGKIERQAAPDVIINIVDASNLQRNLYLLSQILELGPPVILVCNMMDIASNRNITIDLNRLQEQLGIPVVAMQANRKEGVEDLKEAVLKIAASREIPARKHLAIFPAEFEHEVDALDERLGKEGISRFLIERLLLDAGGEIERTFVAGDASLKTNLQEARERLAKVGHPMPAMEAVARYEWVSHVLDGVLTHPAKRVLRLSDRIDRVLTHRLWGTLLLAILMLLIFSAVFQWATFAMDWIGESFDMLGNFTGSHLPDGAFKSLLVDGIIAGVGGVLVFLPQIFILFLFIALLEDSGYMARAAYLMDKLMAKVGLSGKSFIPLLSSFACAIPGIMATRVIENRRDRLTTMLVAPLMTCSARLPVYILLIAAFIPEKQLLGSFVGLQGLTLFAMYLLGIVVAAGAALLLKKTALYGPTPAFVMELPSYKIPSGRLVFRRMFDSGWAFVRRAGTLIFAVAIVVWAAAYYPRNTQETETVETKQLQKIEQQLVTLRERAAEETERAKLETEKRILKNRLAGAQLRQSYLGRAGRTIEPVVLPLGWDWRIGAAAIASFPAREVVISTLAVIYNVGSGDDSESLQLTEQLKKATWDGSDRPVYSIPVALSIMVFFALCAQCAATLAILRRESGGWGIPAFTFFYMTGLAYVAAWLTYQIGSRL